jgi:hypothetical protein
VLSVSEYNASLGVVFARSNWLGKEELLNPRIARCTQTGCRTGVVRVQMPSAEVGSQGWADSTSGWRVLRPELVLTIPDQGLEADHS